LDRSLLSLDFVLEMVFGNRVFLFPFFSFAYTFNQKAYYNEMILYDYSFYEVCGLDLSDVS
jgi:hypothetical protein